MNLPFTMPTVVAAFDIAVLRREPDLAREMACDIARKRFADFGEHPMAAVMYGTRIPTWFIPDPEEGVTDLVWLTMLREGNEQAKEFFSRALRPIARELGAVVIAIAFEAWTVRIKADSPEEASRERSAMPEDLKDQPGREEALVVSYETATTQQLWTAPIYRAGDGVRLGCFARSPANVQGRFTGVLVPLDVPTHA